MFGHKSIPSRIYSYGAKAPAIGAEIVDEQMWLAHRYRNALVELEIERRRRVDVQLASMEPGLNGTETKIAEAESALKETRTSIKKENQDQRAKIVALEAKAIARETKATLKLLRAHRKELRKAIFASEGWHEAQGKIDAWATAEQKHLRAESDLYWGTYLHVEQSMGGARSGAPPRFRSWNGHGHLAVQIIRGISVAEAFGDDTRIRIGRTDVPMPGPQWTPVQVRVDSTPDRGSVFATFAVRLHRPLPPAARIKWVHVIRRRIATRFEWRIQFVVSAPEAAWIKPGLAEDGVVGIKTGWSVVDGNLRVAQWHGSDGQAGELALPADWLHQMKRVQDIRSIRDQHTDAMQSSLLAWTKAADVPEWWKDRTVSVALWRRAVRFSSLVLYWREHRFAGDGAMFDAMEAWRCRDRHLYEFEGNLRDQLRSRRRDIYRNFAAEMSHRYYVAALSHLNLARMHRSQATEDDTEVDPAIIYHMRNANVADLVTYLKESVAQTISVQGAPSAEELSTFVQLGEAAG